MEMFERLSTVLVLLQPGPLNDLVGLVVQEQKAKIWKVRHTTDLVAVGCLLAIVDPSLVGKKEWEDLCGWYEEMDDPGMKVLLTSPPNHKAKLLAKNIIKTPKKIDKTFLKLLIVHQRSTIERRKKIFEKKERQIVRLMYALSKLDQGHSIRVGDIAKEFQVTRRTILRDMELFMMAGYPIEPTGRPGEYRFVENFKSYQCYFDSESEGSSR